MTIKNNRATKRLIRHRLFFNCVPVLALIAMFDLLCDLRWSYSGLTRRRRPYLPWNWKEFQRQRNPDSFVYTNSPAGCFRDHHTSQNLWDWCAMWADSSHPDRSEKTLTQRLIQLCLFWIWLQMDNYVNVQMKWLYLCNRAVGVFERTRD